MVHSSDLTHLSKEERDSLSFRRMEMRNMFCATPERREEFLRMLDGAKVFSKTEPTDASEAGARNLMVDVLEAMGFLDEEFILLMLENMMNFPLVPKSDGKDE